MAQALLHRDQHIGVAARLDEDDPVGVEACKMERRGEQVAPMQAPENSAFEPCEDPGEEDGCRSVVGKLAAARHIVESACRETSSGEMPVDRIDLEGESRMPGSDALDPRDMGTQFFEDGGIGHGTIKTRKEDFVPYMFHPIGGPSQRVAVV